MSWSYASSDNDDVTVFMATANFPNPPMTLDEKREELAAAHQLIQAKYDAGVPFFTKVLFRDLVRQLESNGNPDQKVSVAGLDGLAVQFPVETGQEYPGYSSNNDDRVCIMYDFNLPSSPSDLFLPSSLHTSTKPRLLYRTIQELLAVRDPNLYSVCRAYLPVEVAHSTQVRDTQTNELVYPWPATDYATVRSRFEQAKRSLETSHNFAQLKAALTSVVLSPGNGVDKVVALACSTMTWADHDGAMPSMAQHILALTVRDVLARRYAAGPQRKGVPEIQCYAQDPMYMPIDEQVLDEAGFIVLDDPRAFLEVDESSVVIAIAPDIPIRQIVADIARPAIMIWEKFDVTDTYRTDPVSPRVKQMMEEYIELPFPSEPEYFGNLAIYVRRGG